MSGVDKDKYISSILIVFAGGALLNLAVESRFWHGAEGFIAFLHAILQLHVNAQGIRKIWELVASGGTAAGLYVWLFDKFLWKAFFCRVGWSVSQILREPG
jgi:hypothetical protein